MHENCVTTWQKDERIRQLRWKDLLTLRRREVFAELTISLPWLAAELFLLAQGWYVPATFCAFFFFLTGLRQVHGGYHLALGISREQTDWFLFFMSVLMLGSMHAVKFNHLRHHKHCLSDEDVEAKSARMSALGALAFGPVFPFLLHREALQKGNRHYRRWVVGELAANAGIILCALALWFAGAAVLLLHVGLMALGQCMTAFFAVWTVHHGCAGSKTFARTQRGWLKNFMSYDMFYHVEHHLFPAVPQRHLHIVAERLDAVAPELTRKRVY